MKESEHYSRVSAGEKNIFGAFYPQNNLHLCSPGPSTALRSAQDEFFCSKIADKHRKVKESEHVFL